MPGLTEAIASEITRREERRVILATELDQVDGQLQQLHAIADLAQSLNGGGTVEEPTPGKPSKPATTGDRSLSPGRNGGKAPARRAKASAGSAPSGRSAPASSSNGEGGGSKRAAVLAFVQANGRVKIADVARQVGIPRSAASAYLKKLRDDGQVVAEGQTVNRVYFAPGDVAADTSREAPPSPAPAPLDGTYLDRRLVAELQKGPLTSTAAAEAIDAPLTAVAEACQRLAKNGTISRLQDETYVA